jgi:hypothetical protein
VAVEMKCTSCNFSPSELKDHCVTAKCWVLCSCVGGRGDTGREVQSLIRQNLSYFSRTLHLVIMGLQNADG